MKSAARLTALMMAISALAAQAQGDLKPFTHESTVGEFALECQHPVKKSHPNERLALCITYINSAVQQVGLAKRSPDCWKQIDGGEAAPGPVMDVLFYIAAQPDGRRKSLAGELRNIIVEVAAKACK